MLELKITDTLKKKYCYYSIFIYKIIRFYIVYTNILKAGSFTKLLDSLSRDHEISFKENIGREVERELSLDEKFLNKYLTEI